MFQQVTLIGYVGTEPEMRYTPSGVPVTTFNLATNKKWTGADGQAHEQTVWWRIHCWRKTAEVAAKFVTKGKLLMVQGEQDAPNAYIDRDGKPRASLEVQASTLKLMGGSKPEEAAAGGGEGASGAPVGEEDIPF